MGFDALVGLRIGDCCLLAQHVLGQRQHDGPGRPETAVWNALLTYSGMRAGSSICATHLAICPNMRRKSISWNASRSIMPRPTWPMNRIMGVESCLATWTPELAFVAPGARVTMQMPGAPVSLP